MNAILVWWLTWLVLFTPFMKDTQISKHRKVTACLTDLLFSTHPLATQSLIYIVQRFASWVQIKSDDRILDDGDFVDALLSATNERFERFHKIKLLGYDLDLTAKRAAEVCRVTAEDIFARGRQKTKVEARSVFCYWASREVGIACAEFARRLNISIPAVRYSVDRGEKIAKDRGYQLLDT